MANVTIITTTNAVKIDFGVYASDLAISKGTWALKYIKDVQQNDTHIYISIANGETWTLNYSNQDKGFTVDTIDGVAPSSLADLQTKLSALIE